MANNDRNKHYGKPYREKKAYGEKKSYGDRKPYGEKKTHGDKPYGEKKAFGDRKPYGEKSFGDRKPYGEKSFGDRKPYGEKAFGDRKPYGEKKTYGDKPYGEKKTYGDKPYGEKKTYGDKPYGEKKTYGNKHYGEKKAFGDRKLYGEKSFGDRKPYGEDRIHGDKPFRKNDFGGRKPFDEKPIRPFREPDEFDQAPKSREIPDTHEENAAADELLLMGRNAVWEAMKAEKAVERIYLSQGVDEDMLSGILGVANRLHVRVERIPKARLNLICGTDKHQGVAATLSAAEYTPLETLLDNAFAATENPLFVVLDEIQDPQNLGAIIRSAECAGAQGIIIPEHRAAGLTATVSKVSAGALAYQPVSKVVNLNRAMEAMRERGITLIGADMDGEAYDTCDMTGPVALVIGNEGSGLRRLVSEGCDKLVGIPLCGHIDSLNASVATGILLFEALRQRKGQA